jgi:hypothetical protein
METRRNGSEFLPPSPFIDPKLTTLACRQEWKSFDVDLFTGHNYLMRNVTRVASGLDGTASKTKYTYRCPEVDPPAPIYFYQFSLDGEEPTWTQRFTIASTNGTTVSLILLLHSERVDDHYLES